MTIRSVAEHPIVRSILVYFVLAAQVSTAQVVPPGFGRPSPPPAPAQEQAPQQQQPATNAQQPPNAAGQPVPAPTAGATPGVGGLTLTNASLREVIDQLAQQLKISYVLDPRVQGNVTVNTYGETKPMDNRALLDTILKINGYAM